jgi:hypothetical protein
MRFQQKVVELLTSLYVSFIVWYCGPYEVKNPTGYPYEVCSDESYDSSENDDSDYDISYTVPTDVFNLSEDVNSDEDIRILLAK